MLRLFVRRASTASKGVPGFKEDIRKFIVENPHLGPSKAAVVPMDKAMGSEKPARLDIFRQTLLHELRMVDIDPPQTYLSRTINTKATKENPNLVPGDEPRKINGCVCYDHAHHVSMHLLYRDLPVRCRCGYWFKLISEEDYETLREANWQKIKGQPENTQLLQAIEASRNELARLFEASKDMNHHSPGATEMATTLSIEWKKFKKLYSQIRKKMNEL
ncbi:Cytochrome c oxidase subunit 5B [Cichlidogyrus casuarinus]|uniref:Cytochrome c oxidase subunit 5B n=1 Tax=Cichlidogyrus casuarinus TaxID=1844966 RepID=A0ABD2QIC9_9PLAT